jgi:hypothetical protein
LTIPIIFDPINFTQFGITTLTLLSDLTIGNGGYIYSFIPNKSVTINGNNLIVTNSDGNGLNNVNIKGTTNILVTGTNTSLIATCDNPITINTTGNTQSNNLFYGNSTFTYIRGDLTNLSVILYKSMDYAFNLSIPMNIQLISRSQATGININNDINFTYGINDDVDSFSPLTLTGSGTVNCPQLVINSSWTIDPTISIITDIDFSAGDPLQILGTLSNCLNATALPVNPTISSISIN